jgi:serine/threonine protein kinase
VRRGVNKRTGQEVAVKIVEKRNFTFEPERWQDQLKEIEMLKRLTHDGCVRLLDTYSTDSALYIVMEFIKGGELFDRIVAKGKLSEKATQILTRRLLEAVAYLHHQGIVHRDLKPENILLLHKDDNCLHIKVADFGVARLVGAGCKTLTGSMCYIAPEVLERRDTVKGQGTYAFSCDLWSVGVIVYVCLFGRLPFKTSLDDEQVVQDLRKSVRALLEFKEPAWGVISSDGKDFISQLFKIDAEERLTADQALQHEWIRSAPASVSEEQCSEDGMSQQTHFEEDSDQSSPQLSAGEPHDGQSRSKRPRMQHPAVPLFSQ